MSAPPTLAGATVDALEGGPEIVVDLAALAADADPGDAAALVFRITAVAGLGAALIDGTLLRYTPPALAPGLGAGQVDDVAFAASLLAQDPSGLASPEALVTVALAGRNDPPAPVDDPAALAENAVAAGDVLANDSDPDADALSVLSIGGEAAAVGAALAGRFGTLTLAADGAWSYAADRAERLFAGRSGVDVFEYAVDDGAGGVATAVLRLTVEGADERRVGGGGADALAGGRGADTLSGRGGDDRLAGRGGPDLLRGGGGEDRLLGGGGEDRLLGGGDADRLLGGGAKDRLIGGAGTDRLIAGPGGDRLSGGPGGDRLIGGRGRDRLAGEEGRDTLFGGPGGDRFEFGRGGGRDVAADFQDGRDRLVFASGADRFADLVVLDRGDDVVIRHGGRGDAIRIKSLEPEDLSPADTLFT